MDVRSLEACDFFEDSPRAFVPVTWIVRVLIVFGGLIQDCEIGLSSSITV